MDDSEKFTKNPLNFFIEGVNQAIEETGKNLQELGKQAQTFIDETGRNRQELGEQTQTFIDEIVRTGEAQYNTWYNQQESYRSRPRTELRHQLFTLVHGNWDLAERLLEQVRQNNPGRSEDWYWEKVIYDLHRDNRR
ncbi:MULTISPECIES: hypothetical protein [unclassified Coleofasciculus]|uniref:hypothetical protein n=1 Tax=unclassified Coleofasciculus TaxID=2692782 RepID=UPI00187F8BA0|nr:MULTISPECIES: hypothetical protein [unclassified Coleofasciculus]MBE9126563.1 hypothetical protein [Coleofasciculus sp. LEGE 07081]MBE9149997.1 hypothetical protein [Coleofasciculus sp. LEGE 07092]